VTGEGGSGRTVRPGRPWGEPFSGEADVVVRGDDPELAAAAAHHPGGRILFHPSAASDLARAVGLTGRAGGPTGPAGATRAGAGGRPAVDGWILTLDAVELEPGGGAPALAVNAVVMGTPPGRLGWWSPARPVTVRVDGRTVHSGAATTVVVANGQYLDGADAVPRGHPGDGRLEVQVYALGRAGRRAMRRRLPLGAHVPHPGIPGASGRRVEVETDRPWPTAVDGVAAGGTGPVRLSVRPGAYRLIVPTPG